MIRYFVWHVSTNCNMTFRLNFRLDKKEVFGHKWWTLSNNTNIYCGTGIPGSAFRWISSKKWIFIMLFLTLLTAQYGGYIFGWFGRWAPYSDCMVCFFRKASLKSDTAVALRRSVSKVPCKTLVFSSTFMYFCKLMWLSARSPDVLEAKHYWT